MSKRFSGLLPVVIDVETAGFNDATDALLELAAIEIILNEAGVFCSNHTAHFHIAPFQGANLEPEALEFTGIIPDHPFRYALSEQEMLEKLDAEVTVWLKSACCNRAVLVGHNAHFDLKFLQAAYGRCGMKGVFHTFTSYDTATLGGVVFGESVLAKGLHRAGITYDPNQAHSALYDATQTAKFFCHILNKLSQ